jgi:diketogulonate reductase-like aldo/keto reductase
MLNFSRRQLLRAAASAAALAAGGTLATPRMRTRRIPRSGEELPAVGMGTWRTFDTDERAGLLPVVRALFDAGGSVIDSSPMYGRSETTVGEVLGELGLGKRAFLATKVWTSGKDEGIAQMRDSIRKLGHVDLMQVHNLIDFRTHLSTLRAWKESGTIRYWGVTHYSLSAFGDLESIVRSEKPDFVQLPYSLGVREAEERLLPACAEHGVAVLVMRPFEGGSLFADARKRPLPAWAKEIDCASWGQIFLKFILGHPAVTCPIPATSNPAHMADDLGAAFGRLPDEALRRRMVKELAGG